MDAYTAAQTAQQALAQAQLALTRIFPIASSQSSAGSMLDSGSGATQRGNSGGDLEDRRRAQQAFAQAQLALAQFTSATLSATVPDAPAANGNQNGIASACASTNGDEDGCAECASLKDVLADERAKARARERELLKECKQLRDRLVAVEAKGERGTTEHPSAPIPQRRTDRDLTTPPPAKRQKRAVEVLIPSHSPIGATAASASSTAGAHTLPTPTPTPSLSASASTKKPVSTPTATPLPTPNTTPTPTPTSAAAPNSIVAASRPPPKPRSKAKPKPCALHLAASRLSSTRRDRHGAFGALLPASVLGFEEFEYRLPWWGFAYGDAYADAAEDGHGRRRGRAYWYEVESSSSSSSDESDGDPPDDDDDEVPPIGRHLSFPFLPPLRKHGLLRPNVPPFLFPPSHRLDAEDEVADQLLPVGRLRSPSWSD